MVIVHIVMNISTGTIICMCEYTHIILLLSHNYYYNACWMHNYTYMKCAGPIIMHKNCKSVLIK